MKSIHIHPYTYTVLVSVCEEVGTTPEELVALILRSWCRLPREVREQSLADWSLRPEQSRVAIPKEGLFRRLARVIGLK